MAGNVQSLTSVASGQESGPDGQSKDARALLGSRGLTESLDIAGRTAAPFQRNFLDDLTSVLSFETERDVNSEPPAFESRRYSPGHLLASLERPDRGCSGARKRSLRRAPDDLAGRLQDRFSLS